MSPLNSMSLFVRDAVGDIKSAPTTFSSWDNCMQKAYCKWPAIIGIIVGSLIVLSIVGCLVSCICCGVKCCTGCCGCCYDCCDCGDHGRRPKYADPPAPYYHQPPPPPTMHYGSPAPPPYRGPSTARFDQSTAKKVDEDSLPAMPTWADASTRRIEDRSPVSEDVEMDRFDAPDHHAGAVPAAGRVTRGGYTELPNSGLGSPQPIHQDAYRGAEASSFPMPPPSPRTAGFGGGNSPSPAPYRGFENQAPVPSGRTPNFHTPRPYDQQPSPTSPPAQQPSFSHPRPYDRLPSLSTGAPQPSFSQAPRPYDRLPSPSPPVLQPAYSPYGQAQSQPQSQPYQAFSPHAPSTSPPPFSEVARDTSDRPPSLLQAGRKPAPNSWRNV